MLGTSSAINLVQNEDLNDKTNLGIYFGLGSVSSSIVNNPVSSAGTPFKVYVIAIESSTTIMQVLIPNTNVGIYTRIYDSTNQTWTVWQQYARINDIAPIATKQAFGQGSRIRGTSATHANMDTYYVYGNYYIDSSSDLDYIDNKPNPVYASGARVMVFQFTGSGSNNYKSIQIWIPHITGTDAARYYVRYRTVSTQNVVSWTQWRTFAESTALMGMGTNPYIPEDTTGINLNNYTAPGIYIKQFSTNVSTFLNTPFQQANANYGFSVAAFKLIVEYYNSENNIRQTLIPLYENTGYFVRTRMTGSGGTWKPWTYYSGNYALSYGLTITATQDNPFDLDDLKTIGRYNYGSSSTDYISSFPSDLPTTGGGTIIVENNQLVDRFTQTIFLNSKANAGKFWKRNFTSDGWSDWYRFEGTLVT